MRRIFVVLALFLLSSCLLAEGQPVIAVFHLENETQSGKYRFPDNTLRLIEYKIRTELIKTHRFEVMSEDSMESAIRQHRAESYNSNRDRDYQIELGRKISARYIVIGKIRNDRQDYTVFAEMIDTQRESSPRAGQADFVNKKESYNEAVDSIVSQFLGEGRKQSGFAKPSGRGANSKDWNACEQAKKDNTVSTWTVYLDEFPQGECAFLAKSEIKKLNEKEETNKEYRYLQGRKIAHLVFSDRSSSMMTWEQAVSYCRNLREGGYSDWRLPIVNELKTLVDDRNSKLGDFGRFWSSDAISDVSRDAYLVDFGDGNAYHFLKDAKFNVRCVR